MAPKSKNSQNKKSRNVLDIGVKLKILNLLESGERVTAVARKFKINGSTVRTIRDSKDKIRHSASTLGQFAHLSKVKLFNHGLYWLRERSLGRDFSLNS